MQKSQIHLYSDYQKQKKQYGSWLNAFLLRLEIEQKIERLIIVFCSDSTRYPMMPNIANH